MPNIMLFDVPDVIRVKKCIVTTMEQLGLAEEAVITTMGNQCLVESCTSEPKPMPFIRICSSGSPDELACIVNALRENNIGIDCETLQLSGFIPADKMKS